MNKKKGILFWITGLSGSGKTTIAKKILPQSVKNQLQKVRVVKSALTPIAKRECNICGYRGFF